VYDSLSISRLTARLYGLSGDEYGHRTLGHACISRDDLAAAALLHADLLYGEVLPVGATKLFDSAHLNCREATTLCDLGSGLGKLAIQAFLQFPNLRRVVGCELSTSRFAKSVQALRRLKSLKETFKRRLQQRAQGSAGAGAAAATAGAAFDDSDSERMQEAQDYADREDEEESKYDLSSVAHSSPSLPHLSLHIEPNSGRDSTAATLIRFQETLVARPSFGRRGNSGVHPDWHDLQQLEQCIEEMPLGDETERDGSPPSSSATASSSSVASPPLLALSLPPRRPGCTSSSADCLSIPRSSSFMSHPIRSLELSCGNLFDLREALTADVVICETKFDEQLYPQLCVFLSAMKPRCRLLSYENLDLIYHRVYGPANEQTEAKEEEADGQLNTALRSGNGGAALQLQSQPVQPPPSSQRRREHHKRKREPKRSPVNGAGSSSRSLAHAVVSESVPMETSPMLQSAGGGNGAANFTDSSASSSSSLSTAHASSSVLQSESAPPLSTASSAASSSSASSGGGGGGGGGLQSYTRHPRNPFTQLPVNLSKQDRFYTTWVRVTRRLTAQLTAASHSRRPSSSSPVISRLSLFLLCACRRRTLDIISSFGRNDECPVALPVRLWSPNARAHNARLFFLSASARRLVVFLCCLSAFHRA
jgi:ribosomal protein L12E/L44/L45/RPP1/RPP2